MNTFTLVQRALDATLDDPEKVGLNADVIETGRILSAVQTVVDALTPPDGGRYVVGFANISTASTSLGERRITVSSKPLRDPSLTLVEKAVVIATFAAHEIGHTMVTRPRKDAVREHNPRTGYHAVANLADDIILEPVMVDRFPILADAFTFTGLWVLRATAKDRLPHRVRMSASMTTPDRFNVLLNATRYADIPEIIWAGDAACSERDWGRLWADRLIGARIDDHATFLRLVDEAWERIRSVAEEDDEPEPTETQPGDEPQPGEGEGEDAEGEDGESEQGDEPGEERQPGEPSEDPQDQPTDWDDDEDDESEDESEDEGSGSGEGDEDEAEDDESEDESSGTDDSGESLDGADESDEEGEDGESESDESGEVDADGETPDIPDDATGGGGDPNVSDGEPRSEDDWDKTKVEESMHDSAERGPYDWDGERAEEALRTYASTTVTAFGKHGSLSTTWE